MERFDGILSSSGRIARTALCGSMMASMLLLYSCDNNKKADKPVAVKSESSVPVAEHRSAVLTALIDDYNSAKQEISKAGNPGMFEDSIDRTLKGLGNWEKKLAGKRGLSIPADLYAKSGVAKFGNIFSSDKYWDRLNKGMEGYGILLSGRISNTEINPLAKGFYEKQKSFPSDAYLVTSGYYRGFFATIGGNLVVPGVSFYKAVAEKKLDIGSLDRTPFYFQAKYADAKRHMRRKEYAKAEKELTEIIDQNLIPRDILSNVYEDRAGIYILADNFAKAREDLRWAYGLSSSETERTSISGKLKLCDSMIGFLEQQKRKPMKH